MFPLRTKSNYLRIVLPMRQFVLFFAMLKILSYPWAETAHMQH